MAQGTCSIEGCGKTGLVIRTWCSAHYQRWKAHGDPLGGGPAVVKNTATTCRVEGCSKPVKARDLCPGHWQRWKRYGNVEHQPRDPKPLLDCCAAGCSPTAEARFWAKVAGGPVTVCWLWTAPLSGGGYGTFGADSARKVGAHRWAYEHLIGEVPDGLELDHLCRVRHCVNPWHLEPVTHAENVRRAQLAA